jgi:hypothetical protein
MAGTMRR